MHAGIHVNAGGSPPRLGYREIDSEAVVHSRVVVDSLSVALQESDTLLIPLRKRRITEAHLHGIGIQGIATARLVVDTARRKGLGVEIDLAG